MRKVLFLIFAVFLVISLAFQTADSCDKKTLSASCKKKLLPYKYDSQTFTKIIFKKKRVLLEVEAQVFMGEKYRLVFNRSGMPKDVKISVYTKDKESKKREALFTSDEVKPEEKEFMFEPPRIRHLFVDYDVPADSLGQNVTGCMVFSLGYK